MDKNNLAKKLKDLRTRRGMSQEFLAEESQVSLRTIQRIENKESVPTGETIKRISVALDVAMDELIGANKQDEANDLKSTLIFLKLQLSKTNRKSEIRTFQKFIAILTHLKNKDLSVEQLEAIESYIHYLELDKIPSHSNEIFKEKLRAFRKYLKAKMRFVPKNYYSILGISFTISFVVGIVVTNGIGIAVVLIGLSIITTCILLDMRIKKQGRSLSF